MQYVRRFTTTDMPSRECNSVNFNIPEKTRGTRSLFLTAGLHHYINNILANKVPTVFGQRSACHNEIISIETGNLKMIRNKLHIVW